MGQRFWVNDQSSVRKLHRRNLQRLVPESLEENTTQVALAERRQNNNNQFSGIFWALCDLQSRNHRRSRRDADEQAFFERKPPRHVDGLVVSYGDDLVNVIPAQDARNKTGADSLNLVWSWLSPGKDRAVRRLHGHGLERRLLRLYVFGNASDGSAGAYARDQKIDTPVGVIPNLGPRGLKVNLRIRRIVKLLQHVGVWSRGKQFLGFQNCSLHSPRTRRQNDFRAKSKQQHAPLQAHRLGHGEDKLVSLHGCYKGESDSGVAAGRLDQNGFPGLNPPGTLGIGNHAHADAVFYTCHGILALQFRRDLGNRALRNPVQPHQRRAADQFRYILCDFHSVSIP